MRVLVVDHNGVEPANQTLYRMISESGGPDMRVIIPATWHDGYSLRRGAGSQSSDRCAIVPVPVLFASRTHRLVYRGLARQVREFSPDVLYVNAEPENFQAWECAWIARHRPNIKLVFSTWRNIDHSDGKFPYKASFLHHRIERTVLATAVHGIAFNESAPPIFERIGFRAMTHIPPDLDLQLFRPGEAPAGRPFTIGYAGRLEPLKGIDDLIAAVAGLPAGVRLRIIGGGPAAVHLRSRAAEEGIAPVTDWVEPVSRTAMPGEYHRMNVLVLPSRTGRFWKEQFGRVLVEAMACGVPVIGSDSGEIPRVIGDAGLVFREGDVAGLRAALTRVIADGKFRKALVGKGLTRARERHDVVRVAPMYRTLFARLAGIAGA